jgi:uncharacterized RDD family membrane protein YckC
VTGLPFASRPTARIGRRIASFVIDQVPVLVAAGGVFALVADRLRAGSIESALLPLGLFAGAALVYGIVLVWWLATAGLSPGKRVLGLRVVSVRTGRPIGWGPAILRQVVLGLVVGCTVGIGGLVLAAVAARDPRRRGWHDHAAGSQVIDEHATVSAPAAFAPSVRPPAPGIVPVELPASAPGGPVRPTAPVPEAAATRAAPSVVAPPPVTAPPPVAAAPPAPRVISAVPGLVDDVPGIGSPAPAAPVGVRDDDDPELTRMPVRRGAGTGTWHLDVAGHRLEVRGPGLLGRDPQPRAGEEVVHLVPVEDPQRSLSKTHLQFGLDDGGLWVRDRGSTNGTAVRTPDGARQACPPDTPVQVRAGSTLLIGDHEVPVGRK